MPVFPLLLAEYNYFIIKNALKCKLTTAALAEADRTATV